MNHVHNGLRSNAISLKACSGSRVNPSYPPPTSLMPTVGSDSDPISSEIPSIIHHFKYEPKCTLESRLITGITPLSGCT